MINSSRPDQAATAGGEPDVASARRPYRHMHIVITTRGLHARVRFAWRVTRACLKRLARKGIAVQSALGQRLGILMSVQCLAHSDIRR
jgi:hypothetical protein